MFSCSSLWYGSASNPAESSPVGYMRCLAEVVHRPSGVSVFRGVGQRRFRWLERFVALVVSCLIRY